MIDEIYLLVCFVAILRSLNAAYERIFLSKIHFFQKKICSCAFFVVPLHAFS